MLSELPFASHFAYSPRGTSELAAQSRRIRDLLKQNRRVGRPALTAAELLARRLREAVDRGDYGAFFDPAAVLVPAPRSSRLLEGALWPALELAAALASVRLGARVLPCLERIQAVPKAAFAEPGQRPTATEHYETIACKPSVPPPATILLVDDIVTKGATLLGSAWRLHETFPVARLTAFAAMRTLGLQPDIEALVAPCTGVIRRAGSDADRRP